MSSRRPVLHGHKFCKRANRSKEKRFYRKLIYKPRFETLEDRRLMASDTIRHNRFDPEDVNDDGECTPLDALVIINRLNADQSSTDDVNFVDVNDDGQPTPIDALRVINRLNRRDKGSSNPPSQPDSPTPSPLETGIRTIDGTGNNVANPEWGSTNEQLIRVAPAEYGDGVSSPAGEDRPSAREISNALAAHSDDDTPNERDLTAYIYVWGQFLDHDLDLTKGSTAAEPLPVHVPLGDPEFDPNGTGTQIIPLNRSVFDPSTGTSNENPRQQINQITAWIDGSMVYGSDPERAAALRSFTRGGLNVLETDVGDLPPLNTDNLAIANDAHRVPNTQLFLAGDIRSNENIELTSMHALFVREHNRLAEEIAAKNPTLTDEEIYQQARAIVIAEIQVITYKEWLPALLGSGAIQAYRGYRPDVNPGIANEFSTAAFRLHSSINDDVEFFDNDGRPLNLTYVDDQGDAQEVDGEIALFEAFFNPTLFKQSGIDGILKYAASTHAEEIDNQLVNSLRNFLFGQPGQGGLDLASLNIQRGRDHGLADYNSVRLAYGLPAVTSFSQITSDVDAQTTLEDLYGSVDNIDLWVGGLAEDHVRGSSMGSLFQRIIADQFERLRDGDRFWYQRVFSGRQLAELESTTLSDLIERNSGVEGLQNNVFVFRAEASGQVFHDQNGNGVLGRNESPLQRVTVELLNDEGEIIATTTTKRDGRYRFDQFPETGDFQVRVVLPTQMIPTTELVQEFLVSSGDVRRRNLNFGLRSLLTIAASTTNVQTATNESGGITSNRAFGTDADADSAHRQNEFRSSMLTENSLLNASVASQSNSPIKWSQAVDSLFSLSQDREADSSNDDLLS